MIDEFDYHQDIHSSAWFAHIATSRWLAVYLDWIVVLYLACCVLSFLLMPAGNENVYCVDHGNSTLNEEFSVEF